MIQAIINGIASASIIAIGAISLSLVIRSTGALHFAHGGILTISAYTAYCFSAYTKTPFAATILIAIVVAAAFGGAIEAVVYRTLRRRSARNLVLFIASLGLYVLIENVIALLFGTQTRSIHNWEVVEGWHIAGGVITSVQAISIGAALTSLATVLLIETRSHFGRELRALWSDAELAKSAGVRTDLTRFICVLGASAFAGLAGVLQACQFDASPTMGLEPLMLAIVAIVVGGNTTIGVGPGALLLGLAQNIGVIWLPVRLQSLIVFGIMVIVLVARPRGLFAPGNRRQGAF